MRIAIVCGHFIPNMGYIEVHLANALHQLNHEIAVFTTSKIPAYVGTLTTIDDKNIPYKIERLQADFTLGQMVKSKKLVAKVNEFNPELVICIGVGKLFPQPIYEQKNPSYKIVTLLGDNEETYAKTYGLKNLKNKLIQIILKKKVYELAIEKSTVLFPYTPSTNHIISQFINPKLVTQLHQKSVAISLGFDENMFFFNEEERISKRKELGLPEDELLIITATRIVPEKNLEKIVAIIDECNQKNISITYLIIGFQDNNYSENLKNYIQQKTFFTKIKTLPFMNAGEVRKYYNAADIGIFTRAAISIFEALATGLYLFLPQQNNIKHILNEKNGSYFNELTTEDIHKIKASVTKNREERITLAKKFNYINLTKKIVAHSEV